MSRGERLDGDVIDDGKNAYRILRVRNLYMRAYSLYPSRVKCGSITRGNAPRGRDTRRASKRPAGESTRSEGLQMEAWRARTQRQRRSDASLVEEVVWGAEEEEEEERAM